jgi:hypothetical protein
VAEAGSLDERLTQGMIWPTTPSGSRRVWMVKSPAEGMVLPSILSAHPAARIEFKKTNA